MNIFGALQIAWLELTTIYSLYFAGKNDPSRHICFKNIDCFNCEPPFTQRFYRPICCLPEADLTTRYILYTRDNQYDGFVLNGTNESLTESPYKGSLHTKILIPGFNATLKVDGNFYIMKDELLRESDCNVIIVDWTDDNNYPYVQAVANAREVGATTALLLRDIKKYKGIDYENVHIIGHSLGAHIAGWIGERLNKIGRITGLDPAGPNFQDAPKEVRLDTSDAKFVDIVHTNSGGNIIEGFGLYQPIGDVDFYVNGGNLQPACGESTILNFLGRRTCAHSMALVYFSYSINRCRFPSVSCGSYGEFAAGRCDCSNSVVNYMGFHAKKVQGKKDRKFFLYTKASKPYCDGNSNCHILEDENKNGWILYFVIRFLSLLLFVTRDLQDFGSHLWSLVKWFF